MQAVGKSRNTSIDNNEINNNDNIPTASSIKSKSKPKIIELHGISVHFPFEPYKCQEQYMSQVIKALHNSENALLESPTGTGKTLCLLCSALAWQEEFRTRHMDDTNAEYQTPTILYTSRTHSQLRQVVSELKMTQYRPKHAVLGSRDQMCIHEKVKSTTNINFECGKLTKNRKCQYRNNLDSFRAEEDIQPILDIEELVEMGQVKKICPYYNSRNAINDANILFLPYNYIFDKEARNGLNDVNWKNSIVIFDEAHNLENFASDSASFDLSSLDIAGCIQEIERCRAFLGSFAEEEGEAELNNNNLLSLKGMFLGFEDYLMNTLSPNEGSYSGDFILEVLQKGLKVTHETYTVFLGLIKQISEYMMGVRSATATPRLDFLTSCLKKVFTSETSLTTILAHSRSFRVHISAKAPHQPRTLSYWCFAPSLAMHQLLSLGIRSMIVTSGTLSPLPSYSLELGIPFNITLSNPHVLASPKEQLSVRVLERGVSNKILKSTYELRDTKEYIDELGNTIAAILKIVPGGVLVFFPSYGVMQKCIQGWGGPNTSSYQAGNNKKNFFAKRSTTTSSNQNQFAFPATTTSTSASIWSRLLHLKAIVFEPKSTHQLPEAMEKFKSFVDNDPTKGCLLLSVCRGKISEGIDFSDNLCRMVIVTGIPFAPYLDPRVKLKRDYLDQTKIQHSSPKISDTAGGFSPQAKVTNTICLSGSEWYSQQAHRAVNQAMGRVIRHRFDYGSILLLDARFNEKRNQEGMSRWIRDAMQTDGNVGQTISTCAKFFKQAKARAEEGKKQQLLELQAQRKQQRSVTLQYENDDLLKQEEAQQIILESRSVAMIKSSHDQAVDCDGYVRPTQVIKRIVLQDRNELNKKDESTVENKNSTTPVASSSGIEALYKKEKSDKPSSELSAKKFFQAAKSSLSSDQFSTLRQNILLLKTVGDVKDERNYLSKLQDIIKLILNHKQLIKLFYPLLPTKYKSAYNDLVSRLAIEAIKNDKKEEDDFQPIPKLPSKPKIYLPDHPEEQNENVRKIQNDKRSRVEAMREMSRKRIAASRYNHTSITKSNITTTTTNKSSNHQNPFKVFHAVKTNPKTKNSEQRSFLSPTQSIPEKSSQVDSITKFIQQASKISYIKSPPILAKVNSNVPKDLQCIICKKHMKDPYLANCNHSACLICWSTWLSNKTSCPVCRMSLNTNELSKMVFVNDIKKDVVPKLSQSLDDDFGELVVFEE